MLILVTLMIAAAALSDRWIKLVALRGTVVDWPVGHFALVQNDALVFSWPAPNWVAIILMVIVIVGVVWYLGKHWNDRTMLFRFALLLVVLGALSNLYDRAVYGYVIDWAYFGPWWPIFNLADVMIAVGLVLWLWQSTRLTTKHNAE